MAFVVCTCIFEVDEVNPHKIYVLRSEAVLFCKFTMNWRFKFMTVWETMWPCVTITRKTIIKY